MSAKNIARRREILWHRDPRCHWCGCLTRLMPGDQHKRAGQPKDMATVDHLDSRLSGQKAQYHAGEERTVLACQECNTRRGREEEQRLGIEEQRRRSGRLPLSRRAS